MRWWRTCQSATTGELRYFIESRSTLRQIRFRYMDQTLSASRWQQEGYVGTFSDAISRRTMPLPWSASWRSSDNALGAQSSSSPGIPMLIWMSQTDKNAMRPSQSKSRWRVCSIWQSTTMRDYKTWIMFRCIHEVRDWMGYIPGTDRHIFQNFDVQDSRHNWDHYLFMGCLLVITLR